MSSLWCPLQHQTISHCNKLGWSRDLESPVSAECAKLEDVDLVVLYLYVFRLLTNTQDTNDIFCLTFQFNLDSSPVSAIVCQFGVWFSLNYFFISFFFFLNLLIQSDWWRNTFKYQHSQPACFFCGATMRWHLYGFVNVLFPWYRKTAVAFTINIQTLKQSISSFLQKRGRREWIL